MTDDRVLTGDRVLAAAVERGVLTGEQAAALRALERELSGALPEPEDDEKLRFISGFGDIFVTLGLLLFTGSVGYFANRTFGTAGMWATLAGVAWALAEFFTRRRRMALPSIVLLALFAGASFLALSLVTGAIGPRGRAGGGVLGWFGLGLDDAVRLAAASTAVVGLVALHYWRFRVPITVAAGAAALAASALSLLYALAPDFVADRIRLLVLVAGLAIFAVAMRFDLSDPARVTRRTDIAFWLHLLAAPMIVHPLVVQLFSGERVGGAGAAMAILAVFVALGLVAVVIDRRALLVSGLSYAGFAFGTLLREAGLGDQIVPATLLALGAFVLLLSAGWRPLRAALLRLVPAGFARRLPHPIVSA